MSSRGPPPHLPRNPILHRNPSNTLPAPSNNTSSSTTSVRRNLFPTATATGAPRRQLNAGNNAHSSSSAPRADLDTSNANNDEIIVRDPVTGTFALDTPTLPAPLEHDEMEDEAAEDEEVRRRLIEGWRNQGGGMMVDQSGEFCIGFSLVRER